MIKSAEKYDYPTVSDNGYGKTEAANSRKLRAEFARKREEARKNTDKVAVPKDSYSSGGQGRDTDVDRLRQLARTNQTSPTRKKPLTKEQRMARRRQIMEKGIADERKWRAESVAQKRVPKMPDSMNLNAMRDAGRRNAASGGSGLNIPTIGTMVQKGKVGSANTGATALTYVHSTAKNLADGNYAQAASDALTVAGSGGVGVQVARGKMTQAQGDALGNRLGLASAGVEMLEGAAMLYQGKQADGVDHLCNGFIAGMSSAPLIDKVGKVGVALDLAMNVTGGDKYLQESMTGEVDAQSAAIDKRAQQAATLLKGRSPEQIRAYMQKDRSLLTRALNYHRDQIVQHPNQEQFCKNEYLEMQRIWEAVHGKTY